jgi:hypothetical protein
MRDKRARLPFAVVAVFWIGFDTVLAGAEPADMSAVDFSYRFLRDSKSAEKQFDSRSVVLTGSAKFAGKDFGGYVRIWLRGANSVSIVCNFPLSQENKVSQVRPGDTVRIGGIFSGRLLDDKLQLVLCKLLASERNEPVARTPSPDVEPAGIGRISNEPEIGTRSTDVEPRRTGRIANRPEVPARSPDVEPERIRFDVREEPPSASRVMDAAARFQAYKERLRSRRTDALRLRREMNAKRPPARGYTGRSMRVPITPNVGLGN